MKMLTMRHYILMLGTFFLMLGVFVLTGCNTVEGVGRDVESAGQAIQDTF